MKRQGFDTNSVRMQPMLLLNFQAPFGDVERIMAEIAKIAPLSVGAYDQCAFQSAAGIERYRPLDGAAAGAESDVRKRPEVVEVSFELADDKKLLDRVIEAIFNAHSYQEPVIRVQPVLTSRSKGLDDSHNPNRWWNTSGDWKKKAAALIE